MRGGSLSEAIQRSEVVSGQFTQIAHVHIEKPPILRNARYLIVIRNPIRRAISAFNWRYRLVVQDKAQTDRFEGEYDILLQYKSLNALAEALYDNVGTLNDRAAEQFRSIHHLKEDIAFYLTDLLPQLAPEQLLAVLATETLNQDIARVLEVSNVAQEHSHHDKTPSAQLEMSDKALANLRRFLADDYTCVKELLDIAGIFDGRRQTLLD